MAAKAFSPSVPVVPLVPLVLSEDEFSSTPPAPLLNSTSIPYEYFERYTKTAFEGTAIAAIIGLTIDATPPPPKLRTTLDSVISRIGWQYDQEIRVALAHLEQRRVIRLTLTDESRGAGELWVSLRILPSTVGVEQ